MPRALGQKYNPLNKWAFASAVFTAQYFLVLLWFSSGAGWPERGMEFPAAPANAPGRDDGGPAVLAAPVRTGEVEYIPTDKLSHEQNDIFSAAWWQRMSRFLELDVERYVETVESDAFKPILRAGRGFADARMTRDWLDFSVEHLSKWWKMGEQPAIYAFAVGKLQSYIHRTLLVADGVHDTTMESTLALIPYGISDKTDEIGQRMWMVSLAATIASLIQHGVARVLVVGHYDADTRQAMEAFEYLLDHDYHGVGFRKIRSRKKAPRIKRNGVENSPFSTKWGDTELAFVHTNDIKSKHVVQNVPKGALHDLQKALRGESSKDGVDPKYFLGENGGERFKYLYFTECDQILNARLRPSMLDTLDEGRIIVPHRIQPIPHPLDLDHLFQQRTKMVDLTEISDKVAHLRPGVDACCDTGEHLEITKKKAIPGIWWQQGFNGRGDFEHLKPYEFLRITSGTGIVALSSTGHSRRCRPVADVASCESVPISGVSA